MPRLFVFAGKMRWLAVALLVVASQALDMRAQLHAESPPNPLRPGQASPMMRIVPVPSDPPVIRPAAADDELQSEPPSVVPQALGQPGLLPAPATAPHFGADHLADPNLIGPNLNDGSHAPLWGQ